MSARLRPRLLAIAGLAALAGCVNRPAAPPPRPLPAPVPLAATPAPIVDPGVAAPARPCLTPAEIRRLRAARPKPLRAQKMPDSPAERVAKTAAQLGQYEAKGAWADQVEAAIASCDIP